MNYSLFETMTQYEAEDYLRSFLAFGKNHCVELLEPITHFTVDIDFQVGSLVPVLRESLTVLRTNPKNPDLSLPEFIRNSDTYKQNLFEFDEPSRSVILASAYYLGETFIRAFENLSWGLGNQGYQQCNAPVIKGFSLNEELPVLTVCENMFGSIIAGLKEIESIDTTIQAWRDAV